MKIIQSIPRNWALYIFQTHSGFDRSFVLPFLLVSQKRIEFNKRSKVNTHIFLFKWCAIFSFGEYEFSFGEYELPILTIQRFFRDDDILHIENTTSLSFAIVTKLLIHTVRSHPIFVYINTPTKRIKSKHKNETARKFQNCHAWLDWYVFAFFFSWNISSIHKCFIWFVECARNTSKKQAIQKQVVSEYATFNWVRAKEMP